MMFTSVMFSFVVNIMVDKSFVIGVNKLDKLDMEWSHYNFFFNLGTEKSTWY